MRLSSRLSLTQQNALLLVVFFIAFELVTAVQYAIDVLGERFQVIRMHAPVLDLTHRGDIAQIEAKLVGTEVLL